MWPTTRHPTWALPVCRPSIWFGLMCTCLVDLGPLSPWLAGWGLLIVRLCHLRSVPHGGTATGWLSKVLLEGARCSGASTATKQASRQATSTNSPAPPPIRGEGEDIILTERQSCYLGKSATGGKKEKTGNKECREVAARRNPSSTVPRSIIPHSPNPASSATASPSAPPPPPNIAQDLEKLNKTKTNWQNLDLWLKSKEISLSWEYVEPSRTSFMSGTFLRLSLVVGAVMVRVADCRTNLPATSHPSLTQPMTYSTTIPYLTYIIPIQYSGSKKPDSWPLESSCSWQTMCPPSPWRMKQWPGDRIGPSSFSLQDIAYTPPSLPLPSYLPITLHSTQLHLLHKGFLMHVSSHNTSVYS